MKRWGYQKMLIRSLQGDNYPLGGFFILIFDNTWQFHLSFGVVIYSYQG